MTDNTIPFDGPRKKPTENDKQCLINYLKEIIDDIENDIVDGVAIAVVGKKMKFSWVTLPGSSSDRLMAATTYLSTSITMEQLESFGHFQKQL